MGDKEEIFVDIKGYEGLYKISNFGRVFGVKHGYILRSAPSNKYKSQVVTLWKNNKSKTLLVHRLVLITFSGIPRNNEECRHLDGNTLNNHIDNLKWGTHQENEQDKILHGTDNKGSKHGNSVLTEDQVKEIRRLYSTGKYFQRELAELFNVHLMTINDIIHYRKWKHVIK